jgi:alpha-beta hydrolase superfamily lysophospholipase
MTLLIVSLAFVLLFMIFISLVLLVIGPEMLLQPHRRTLDFYRKITTILHPSDAGLVHEDLTLKTAEGIPLSCWFVSAGPGARGTVLYLHGVSESKVVGLPLAAELHRRGFHVFLYDSRRHGDSGGTYCTYGFYEKHDASAVISYLSSRTDITVGRIGLFGTSMGAAVALQVAAMDSRVSAVVAESGFATLRSVFDDYQKRMIKLPWHYLRNLVIKRSEHLAHFKANAVSPLDAVAGIHIPLLISHGTADDRIKCSYSESVYRKANEPKELMLIPGAKHHNMAEMGGAAYQQKILSFFERYL